MVTLGTCTMSVKGVGFLCFCQGFRYLSNLKLHFLYLAEVGANSFRKVMKSQRQKGHCVIRFRNNALANHCKYHHKCQLTFSLSPNHSALERVSQLKTPVRKTQKRHHDQPSSGAISIPPPSKPPHVQLVLLLLAWSPWVPAQ